MLLLSAELMQQLYLSKIHGFNKRGLVGFMLVMKHIFRIIPNRVCQISEIYGRKVVLLCWMQ